MLSHHASAYEPGVPADARTFVCKLTVLAITFTSFATSPFDCTKQNTEMSSVFFRYTVGECIENAKFVL